jgi:arsenate reductase
LIKKLNIKPIELVRQKEAIWIEHYKGKLLTDVDIIKAMAIDPIVIERPIVIKGNKAIIGREIKKLNDFI